MRRLLLLLGLAVSVLVPAATLAVTTDDFKVADTQDVVDICTTPESDPMYTAAVAFCQGYLVGAYQYHKALFDHSSRRPVVCFEEPRPTRTQAIERFIAWVKAHPDYGSEAPAEALTKFLVETYPCPSPAPAPVTSKKK